MDFNLSNRQREWLDRVSSFMEKHVRPAQPIYRQQDEEGERWKVIPIVEELKASELSNARHPYTQGLLECMPSIGDDRHPLPVLERKAEWAL